MWELIRQNWLSILRIMLEIAGIYSFVYTCIDRLLKTDWKKSLAIVVTLVIGVCIVAHDLDDWLRKSKAAYVCNHPSGITAESGQENDRGQSLLPYVPMGGITPLCTNRSSILWLEVIIRELYAVPFATPSDGEWDDQLGFYVEQFKLQRGFDNKPMETVDLEVASALLAEYKSRGLDMNLLKPYADHE